MKCFRFPPFTLDAGRFELKRDEEVVVLPRIPMEILQLLLTRADALLTRAEVASRLWPGSDLEDVVPSINTAINRIRKALGDDPLQPVYVQTVIGKGYRFIAPVEVIEEPARPPEAPTIAAGQMVMSDVESLLHERSVTEECSTAQADTRRPWLWCWWWLPSLPCACLPSLPCI